MDHAAPSKPHTMLWALTALALLLLYAASWPVVESTAAGSSFTILIDEGHVVYEPSTVQKWTDGIYFPMHWLMDSPVGPTLLTPYYRWWLETLHRDFLVPSYRDFR